MFLDYFIENTQLLRYLIIDLLNNENKSHDDKLLIRHLLRIPIQSN